VVCQTCRPPSLHLKALRECGWFSDGTMYELQGKSELQWNGTEPGSVCLPAQHLDHCCSVDSLVWGDGGIAASVNLLQWV